MPAEKNLATIVAANIPHKPTFLARIIDKTMFIITANIGTNIASLNKPKVFLNEKEAYWTPFMYILPTIIITVKEFNKYCSPIHILTKSFNIIISSIEQKPNNI